MKSPDILNSITHHFQVSVRGFFKSKFEAEFLDEIKTKSEEFSSMPFTFTSTALH
jgi:hypothetical protein